MLSKRHRQQLIKTLVRQQRLGTQQGLVKALGTVGCEVTQATISRDIREIGLQKSRDELGRPVYSLAEGDERRDPQAACARMLAEFGYAVLEAQHLVLVKSEPGTASGLGKVIDELGDARILGTVAGDDTLMIVTSDNQQASDVGDYLRKLGG